MRNKNKQRFEQKQKGATLVGLLVGAAIIGITFTSGLTLISRNIRFSSVTAHEIAASALAEEGIELIRNIRDTGDNYYIKETEGTEDDITGFDKINKSGNYALDYSTRTYNATDILDGVMIFSNSNAGLCLNNDLSGFYQACPLSPIPPLELKFIRKITLAPNHSECQNEGILVTATVYWTEFWEGGGWPNNINDARITEEDNAGLHKVQIQKCMYDWRPK